MKYSLLMLYQLVSAIIGGSVVTNIVSSCFSYHRWLCCAATCASTVGDVYRLPYAQEG